MTNVTMRRQSIAAMILAAVALAMGGCSGCAPKPKKKAPVVHEAPPASELIVRGEPDPIGDAAPEPDEAAVQAALDAEAEKKAELEQMAATLLGKNNKDPHAGAVVAAARGRGSPSITRAPPRRRSRPEPAEEVEEPSDDELEPEPEIAETLTDARFSRVVADWRGVKRCLSTTAIRGPQRNGALSISFKIGPDGAVQSSIVSDTSNDVARQIAPCVSRQAKKIRFPAYTNVEIVNKEAKFVF